MRLLGLLGVLMVFGVGFGLSFLGTTSSPCLPPNNEQCTGQPTGTQVADPRNCHQYYLCVGEALNPDVFVCDNEFYFNGTECVPEDIPCTNLCQPVEGSCANKPNGTQVTDPDDCHDYFLCVGGEIGANGTAFDCNDGDYFNGTECVEETIPCDLTPTTPVTTEPPVFCPIVCESGVDFIPDPYDCSKFYQCNLSLEPSYCTEPMPYFDGVACINDPSKCCDTCTPYCDEAHLGQNIVDPNNCTCYYVCNEEGVPTTHQSCMDGEVFNNVNQTCVSQPEGCQAFCTPPPTTTTSTEPPTTTEFVPPPPPFCEEDKLCTQVPPGDLVGDAYDCHIYYRCSNESKPSLSFTCKEGLYFDGVGCVDEQTPCTPSCVQYCPIYCDLQNGIDFIPDAYNCSVYYLCSGADPIKRSCTPEAPYYNGSYCIKDPTFCCDACVPYCTAEAVEVKLKVIDPIDCHSYYNCEYEGVPVTSRRKTCGEGAYFNTDDQQCIIGDCNSYCS